MSSAFERRVQKLRDQVLAAEEQKKKGSEDSKQLRAKGKELGIKGAHNMNLDKLAEQIAELEAKENGDNNDSE